MILVPADPPRKVEQLRIKLRSKKLLTFFGIIAVLAGAAMLWIALEPQNKELNLKQLMIPASILGSCLLFFLLAALLGKNSATEEMVDISEELVSELTQKSLAVKSQPISLTPEVTGEETLTLTAVPGTGKPFEVYFEEWSSEPYTEIIDDSLIVEIFNDEMIAPDHLVFSVRATD
ncbi:MAG: hypothetical protein JST84_30735 [Acidobacteria bacterium]|nr:hypothetical protein [Acidobacteriota bacterium]